MRTFSLILLTVCIVYGYTELRRWRSPELHDLLSAAQRARRIVNFAALCLVIGMSFGGTFLPVDHVSKRIALLEVIYWSVCLAVAAIIPLIAVVEYRATFRDGQIKRLADERDEAFRQVVEVVAKVEKKKKRREELSHRNGHD